MIAALSTPVEELLKGEKIQYKGKVVPKIKLTYGKITRSYRRYGLIDTGCPYTLIDLEVASDFGILGILLTDKMTIGVIEVPFSKPRKFSSISVIGRSGKEWTVEDFDIRIADLGELYPIIIGDDFVQASGLIPKDEFIIETFTVKR